MLWNPCRGKGQRVPLLLKLTWGFVAEMPVCAYRKPWLSLILL